jgi:hypothetical protein
MADDSSGTNSSLAFIVGGLVVAVGVVVYFLYGAGADKADVNIKIDVPEVITPEPKSGG